MRALRCVLTPTEVVREGQNLTQREALTHPSNKSKLKFFFGEHSLLINNNINNINIQVLSALLHSPPTLASLAVYLEAWNATMRASSTSMGASLEPAVVVSATLT